MNKFPIPNKALTGWASSDARLTVGCPHCGAEKGFYCETPGGQRAMNNHVRRNRVYELTIGKAEFIKRHSKFSSSRT